MAVNTCGQCSVDQSYQPPASSVAGNIGIVHSKVMIWEHDPFWARPNQCLSFPFSQYVPEVVPEEIPDTQWQLDSVFLRSEVVPQDMFVATINPFLETPFQNPDQELTFADVTESPVDPSAYTLDFVGSIESGVGFNAASRMPGGVEYNNSDDAANFTGTFESEQEQQLWESMAENNNTGRNIFPHQLWIYIGTLFKPGVPWHPSEYQIPLDQLISLKGTSSETSADPRFFTIEEIQGGAKWNYTTHIEDSGVSYWPYMVTKHVPGSEYPVHWTLEKFLPVFQGEDFFVTITMNKEVDEIEDIFPEGEYIGSLWEEYKYLMYQNEDPPAEVQVKTKRRDSKSDYWVDGISNAAFYIPPTDEEGMKPARKAYWWKYKTYILIEIGAGDPDHNYFIELVKGRHPRFLHLGREWDNPNRLQGGPQNSEDFRYMRKCRVLGVYEGLSCNELFKKRDFRVHVRSHLGRIVVTFEGYEHSPWVINRQDNDPEKFDYTKQIVPMVVPASKMRLHGGNLSCTINWSPLSYLTEETIPYRDRQADTTNAENKDLYMTFSHIGGSNLYKNAVVRKRFFSDDRFGLGDATYDCDAYFCNEINRNRQRAIAIYEYFYKQYKKYGKGWAWEYELDDEGNPLQDEDTGLIKDRRFLNGLSLREGGNPHILSIYNSGQKGQGFTFGLTSQQAPDYPYKEQVSKWDVDIELRSGSVRMPNPVGYINQAITPGDPDPIIIDKNAKKKLFINAVTPIATNWRLLVLGGEKPVEGKVEPFDISPLVLKISDSWSANDYSTITHEAKINCYIPIGYPIGNNEALFTLGQKLKSLHNKAFYVSVSYWWDNGIGERDAIQNRIERNGNPYNSDLLIQMTGIAYGAELSKEANRLYMDFTVKDYMSVLEKQFIFNSPFFDGVIDAEAVYELVKLAGFDASADNTPTRINRQPLGYLAHVIHFSDQYADGKFFYNGEESRCRVYALPGSYATLANPAVRFRNGETYQSALTRIAELATKVVYFDRWGVLRFENTPAIDAAFNSGEEYDFTPKFKFTTSPFNLVHGDSTHDDQRLLFNPCLHASHLVYEVVKYGRSVEECVNQIVLFTATNDLLQANGEPTEGGLIVEGYTFFEQMWDPEAEGFLGFRKPFYQSNGVFGGIEGVRNALMHYAKMKFPPVKISFETYGVPGLKALDIITLDDNLFYITEINHELDPKENRWWMSISGEWLKPYLSNLGFLEETGPSTESE